MKLLREYDAIVFGVDGVLWRAGEVHRQAFRIALAEIGLAAPDADVTLHRTEDLALAILQACGMPTDAEAVQRLVQRKEEIAAKALRSSPPITKHAVAVVNRVAQRLKVGLATRVPRAEVDAFVEAGGLGDRISAIVATGTGIAQGEHVPGMYATVCAELAVAPSRAVAVLDAVPAVRAAQAAGLDVIGIGGRATVTELAATKPVAVITDIWTLVEGEL